MLTIVVGADHGGFYLKQYLVDKLKEEDLKIIDVGIYRYEEVDYPDIAFKAAEKISKGEADRGILICGTGIGMCNATKKVPNIITALCTNEYMAKMSRLHNAANVLCMGGRVIGFDLGYSIVKTWLKYDPIYDEKRIRRRKKIDEYKQ